MKTLECTMQWEFNYGEKEMPTLQKAHAIIKIKRIGICGIDYYAFEGTQPFF